MPKVKHFRHDIYDAYKANRNSMPSELAEQTRPIIELVKSIWNKSYTGKRR